MNAEDIVIVSAKRTPIGNFLSTLSPLTAPELSAIANRAAIETANLSPDAIDEVILGLVLSAGIGQAPARQAALMTGIPHTVPATTVNKMCGSGMQSILFAYNQLKASPHMTILAGGMENMSQTPYLLPKARTGYRLGHHTLVDHLFRDGLEDAYEKGRLMGAFAEMAAKTSNVSRQAQDEFAIASLERALTAQKTGAFDEEIVPIATRTEKNENIILRQDEGPTPEKLTKIPKLKPVFSTDGTITAANASSISDGAASLVLMRYDVAKKRGLTPMAKIVACATHANAPEWFTKAPIGAIEKVLKHANWTIQDVDLFEINEAFAIVVMLAMQALHLPHNKVNIHGGALTLGHPIGASGARILVTLLYALKRHQKKRGVASLCIGGGEALALAIEYCSN